MADASAAPDEALPGELASLVEPLAVEIHLAWMRAKLMQGWQPGILDLTTAAAALSGWTGWTGWDIAWSEGRARRAAADAGNCSTPAQFSGLPTEQKAVADRSQSAMNGRTGAVFTLLA